MGQTVDLRIPCVLLFITSSAEIQKIYNFVSKSIFNTENCISYLKKKKKREREVGETEVLF